MRLPCVAPVGARVRGSVNPLPALARLVLAGAAMGLMCTVGCGRLPSATGDAPAGGTGRVGFAREVQGAAAAELNPSLVGEANCGAPPEQGHLGALVMAVMDPLAAPLACECVKGFAQRDYGRLAGFLETYLGRPIEVVYAESLETAIRLAPQGRLDVIIGKQSVVRFDATRCRLAVQPVAMLTDKEGRTTLRGLFIVARDDPAAKLADLAGYRILFGPEDCAEKHAAALVALRAAGVPLPEQIETRPSCTNAALDVLENEGPARTAAVISDYARVLLEGCGTVKPGELRVVGQTPPVPFVTVFVVKELDRALCRRLAEGLQAVARDAELLTALESKSGFVLLAEKPADQGPAAAAPQDGSQVAVAKPAAVAIWPGWRGPGRDGLCTRLPDRLPENLPIVWQKSTTGSGLSGVAATEEYVIIADRDSTDRGDIFRCLRAEDGQEIWKLEYPAAGKLDYGNSPRATPLIVGEYVYLLGAFGQLHCVSLPEGRVVWKRHLAEDYGAEVPTWGYCASPLWVDGKLVVNPGGRETSLVALDAQTGKEVWRSPGLPAAYASFIVGHFGGVRQIVGYDAVSLGGWDVHSGRRLWTLLPPQQGDFNVPTPIDAGGRLLVSSENNGTRLYEFDAHGQIIKQPVAECPDLAPDCHTPVFAGGKLFGCWMGLWCLDVDAGLKTCWSAEDEAFEDYTSIISDGRRLLIATVTGELLLVAAGRESYELLSRVQVLERRSELLSHPAVVGNRLYLRDTRSVCCARLW